MPICHSRKLIFVHIPRTGGGSIEELLGMRVKGKSSFKQKYAPDILYGREDSGQTPLQHLTLREIKQRVEPEAFDQYYKFTFVRNPFDRLLSYYFWRFRKRAERALPFSAWLSLMFQDYKRGHVPLKPQRDYLVNDAGSIEVDFLGRFERFEDDVEKLRRHLRIENNLRHVHRSTGADVTHYSDYYDKNSRKIAEEIYENDLIEFGYKFEKISMTRRLQISLSRWTKAIGERDIAHKRVKAEIQREKRQIKKYIIEEFNVVPAKLHTDTCLAFLAHNRAAYLRIALESILAQARKEFCLIVLDDASTDGSFEIIQAYAQRDSRIFCFRNRERQGLVRSKRLAFELGKQVCHSAKYFAWVSDHDLWSDRWLERMAQTLDANPGTVLAYPVAEFMDEEGKMIRARKSPMFDTVRKSGPTARFIHVCNRIRGAGNMVYGLYRRSALEAAGVLRPYLLPDRLLMFELSLRGDLRQVNEVLWYRRIFAARDVPFQNATLIRQKTSLFTKKNKPPHLLRPWWLSFGGVFFRYYVLSRRKDVKLSKVTMLLLSLWVVFSQAARDCYKDFRALVKYVIKSIQSMLIPADSCGVRKGSSRG